MILKVKDDNGFWWRNKEDIERVFVSYYYGMFGSIGSKGVEDICEVVKNMISSEIDEVCSQEFYYADVNEVLRLDLNIPNNGKIQETLNKTFIFLIPKGNNPSSPNDFGHISFCNVTMKIVTKFISKRLKLILQDIIYEEQCAFFMGRQIAEKGLIAMECFHWLKKNTKGKKGVML
ncbi:hypothetical protein KIW84_033225 [Lathyrus oleraceus]|uniref:Reverse transcriptase domain-containing protein n=1 Tax=Pisum sativum TaxID=3888 RepID=A0A9D5AXQ8_PEA|nr:hypothetical protein KIW84_033225 [Pisum sativum]